MGFDGDGLERFPVGFLYFSVEPLQNGLLALFFIGLFFYNF